MMGSKNHSISSRACRSWVALPPILTPRNGKQICLAGRHYRISCIPLFSREELFMLTLGPKDEGFGKYRI